MTATRTRAYIGLGSNLDDPLTQIRQALAEIAQLPASRLTAQSSLYRTPPMGPPDQPPYINAVAALDTALAPHALLDELQKLETAHRRVRDGERWGPRTLDLDLLIFGSARLDDERLKVPHPGLPVRAFVLVPLAEIAPALDVPGVGPVTALLAGVDQTGVERL